MNYWILQCNPNKYCYLKYMEEHKKSPDTWGIRLFRGQIELGDTAFIWLSKHKGKETRGIYAMAEVTRGPSEEVEVFPYEVPYWRDKEEGERQKYLIRLELRYTFPYTDKLLHNPVLKAELEAADLGNLLILRMPERAIYSLAKEEGEKIKGIIQLR